MDCRQNPTTLGKDILDGQSPFSSHRKFTGGNTGRTRSQLRVSGGFLLTIEKTVLGLGTNIEREHEIVLGAKEKLITVVIGQWWERGPIEIGSEQGVAFAPFQLVFGFSTEQDLADEFVRRLGKIVLAVESSFHVSLFGRLVLTGRSPLSRDRFGCRGDRGG